MKKRIVGMISWKNVLGPLIEREKALKQGVTVNKQPSRGV